MPAHERSFAAGVQSDRCRPSSPFVAGLQPEYGLELLPAATTAPSGPVLARRLPFASTGETHLGEIVARKILGRGQSSREAARQSVERSCGARAVGRGRSAELSRGRAAEPWGEISRSAEPCGESSRQSPAASRRAAELWDEAARQGPQPRQHAKLSHASATGHGRHEPSLASLHARLSQGQSRVRGAAFAYRKPLGSRRRNCVATMPQEASCRCLERPHCHGEESGLGLPYAGTDSFLLAAAASTASSARSPRFAAPYRQSTCSVKTPKRRRKIRGEG
jgi:hypothetical protein